MAKRSGWDTIFAEPIRWKRNQTVNKCWDHIKYTLVAAGAIIVMLWFTQGHRYLYNVLYGPFVLSEQEIVDTRPDNLWKQYIQVHHGRPVDITTKDIRCEGRPCSAMLVQFKNSAAHNSNINKLLVQKPKSSKHESYSKRHSINFHVMPVRKLQAIIRKAGLEKSVLPGMEKSDLVSIISKAYDSNPKSFNKATQSEILVGYLTDFDTIDVYRQPEFMALVLNVSDPYFSILSFPSLFALLYVYFVLKVLYYIFKLAKTWVSSFPILNSFGSTKFQTEILQPLKHMVQSEGLQENTSLSVYDFAALKLQQEIFSTEVSKIVNEEHFRLFVTDKHVIYVRNDVIDVISVSQIDEIRAWSDTCDVVLSSGQLRTLHMSPDQTGHLRNVLSSRCARFRQLEEERRVKRQQEEDERLRRQKEEEENRKRDEAEQEVRRRRQQEEMVRRINEFLASLAERANEHPAAEEVVEDMKASAFKLEVDSEENCVICQDGMKKGQVVIPFPCPAEHQFHEDCMLQYLKHGSSCPLCRHQVEHNTVDGHAVLDILQLMFT
ncbi:uncharacterized protein LOC144873578 isoform X2 [Branchiostoma floridae x Branchiostoma japonicum]